MTTETLRLLLIEDEEAHAELVQAAFEDEDVELLHVVSLAAAEAALRDREPHVVLADWRLPDGDASQMLGRGLPVVIMTSHGNERVAVEMLRAGAVDYISKSVATIADLPRVVGRAWREWTQAEELRQTQERLRESEDTLNSIVRTVPEVIYRLDCDGRITFINDAVERYGYCVRDLVGCPLLDLIHPADRDRAQRRVNERRTRLRRTQLLELRLLTHEQSTGPVESRVSGEEPVLQFSAEGLYAGGQPCTAAFAGTQGVARDVSERRRREELLRRLAAAVDGTAEGLLLIGGDGCVEYANPAFEAITGAPCGRVIGRPISDIAPLDWPERHAALDCLREGRPWRSRLELTLESGVELKVDITLSPLIDPVSGECTSHVAVMRDVREQLALEQQLRHAVKMEAIGTLAGGIAHDFNNILAGILGHAELALMDLPGEPTELTDSLQQIVTSSQRAADLTRQILAFAREGEQSRHPVEVGPLVKEAVKLLRATIPPTIEIRLRVADDRVKVLADGTQLHQVVMNLCTNAYQAMAGGRGVLSVELDAVQLAQGPSQAGGPELEPGAYLRLRVNDTGPGIAPEVLPRVFDPFFTTKALGQGTGMGLATVDGIVAAHGGRIAVTSRPGATVFTVFLPVDPHAVGITTAEESSALAHGQGRVLVVDDESELALVAARLLERLGYQATAVTSGDQALAVLAEAEGRYDVMLCDQMMPGMTGSQLGEIAHRRYPDLPLVLVTGYAGAISAEQAQQLGFCELLGKPMVMSKLGAALQRAMRSGVTT